MRFFKEKRNFHAEIEIFNLKIKKSSVKKKNFKKRQFIYFKFFKFYFVFFFVKKLINKLTLQCNNTFHLTR